MKSLKSTLLNRIVTALPYVAFIIGFLALAFLVWVNVRPIPTAEIKVPVATDQASYYPGEEVSGIFFGDTYYKGEVRVLREVFCKNYQGVIKPQPESAFGNFFSTIGTPRHFEGESILIGNLPADIPIGLNCVLQFTNVYDVPTIFGSRHVEYQYYTQNFSIVTKERRDQLDCEASGSKDCHFINDTVSPATPSDNNSSTGSQSSPEASQGSSGRQNTTNVDNSTTNNSTTTNNPAPHYEEQCVVNVGILKAICSQVLVQ